MLDAPLIGCYRPDDVLAWESDGPRSASEFLSEVNNLAEVLPDRPSVLNLLTSRYEFLVGFAAAILRRQVTLLPQSRAPDTLRRIAVDHERCYCLTDRGEPVHDIPAVVLPAERRLSRVSWKIPQIPLQQHVAIAFTSGSTGQPTPNLKTWDALVSVARATARRLGLKAARVQGVVATVPHQHMFGLEASVMLPIQQGLTMHAGRPLFPEDIRAALTISPERSLLVTTPLHLRACLLAGVRLPPMGMILSATSPLTSDLARDAEQRFHAPVHEIFGFAEAGSVASRRTVTDGDWRMLDGVALARNGAHGSIQAPYLPCPVPIPDRISVTGRATFHVLGRVEDQVNIAGHRASLGDLTRQLLEVEGVHDGVFIVPEGKEGSLSRLMALVVAPGKTQEDIQHALRRRLNPVFLPRPLLLLPRLPRNETGKLPREALRQFMERWKNESSHDA